MVGMLYPRPTRISQRSTSGQDLSPATDRNPANAVEKHFDAGSRAYGLTGLSPIDREGLRAGRLAGWQTGDGVVREGQWSPETWIEPVASEDFLPALPLVGYDVVAVVGVDDDRAIIYVLTRGRQDRDVRASEIREHPTCPGGDLSDRRKGDNDRRRVHAEYNIANGTGVERRRGRDNGLPAERNSEPDRSRLASP